MQALINFSKEPHSVELRDIAVPEIGDDDVLLAVKAVGVCGSDLHQYAGKHSWPVNYPVVLGHEFGGVIARVGPKVRAFREGDRVVSETAAVLPQDSAFIRQGLYHLEPKRLGFGYGVDGAMAPFVKVPVRCLHHIPDSLSFEMAALTEPCCVAYNCVAVQSHLRPGDSVVVIGPGPIGLLCAMFAKLAGAGHVTIIGIPADARRLAHARTFCADTTLGGEGGNPIDWVRGFGDGLGVDLVIDAAGVSSALKLALELVRPGGQITKVGWGREPVGFSLDLLVQKSITLRGSFSHNWLIWEKVISLLAKGAVDLGPILSRVASMTSWREVFADMESGRIIKGVLQP